MSSQRWWGVVGFPPRPPQTPHRCIDGRALCEETAGFNDADQADLVSASVAHSLDAAAQLSAFKALDNEGHEDPVG